MSVSSIRYYLSSIPTLLTQVKNWDLFFRLLFKSRPVDAPAVVELKNGLKFQVRTAMDIWVIKETCLDCQYADASTALQDGWVIFDIGAALGEFAIYAAKKCPNAQVFAYEPSPQSFQALQANIKRNACQNIQAFPQAVAAKPGFLELKISAEAVQHTTTNIADPKPKTVTDVVRVPSISLSQAFEQSNLRYCDYLKIDCEGAEYDIFFNTPPALLRHIQHIVMEYHNGVTAYNHTDLQKFFEQNDFQVRVTPNVVHNNIGYLYAFNRNFSRD